VQIKNAEVTDELQIKSNTNLSIISWL